ncbi:hypothetical protein Pflav_049260 [Phytohabitans flavus]|uniref:Uncharacterized protein n=1 Tax=Phytohabitans flavus TaxID=1076124 RepID=A0A6F8XXF0_9ACTN|nr:hypothetical protein Pflav_049260 [Phytohabitans flavus]
MKIQPRQQLLDIWQATVRASFQDGKWSWGGRNRTNSISDAEQLLSILLPATEISFFQLEQPNETADDVLAALRGLGDAVEVPQVLVRVITDYMERYTDASGTPTFAGDTYFRCAENDGDPTAAQASIDVVDSFAMSVTLSLATMSFVRGFRREVRRESLRSEIDRLEAMASKRLSAALVGLLRSFTISVMDADSAEGQQLIRTTNQQGLPVRQVIEELRVALRQVRAALREITIGFEMDTSELLDNPNRLFECGWSWGSSRTHQSSGPTRTWASSPGESPRPRHTSTSPWWRWTRSKDSSPSAPGSWRCSTRSSSGSRGRFNCAGTSRRRTGRRSPVSGVGGGRSKTFHGAPRTAWSPTTSACW